MTLAVLTAYMDERGSAIASEDLADRAIELFTEYLTTKKQQAASVAFWSPAQQLECARWLHANYQHSAGYIARLFNVMRSAFLDACKLKLRPDPTGCMIEAQLIGAAPEIVMRQDKIAEQLNIPLRKPRRKTLSLDDMARVIDAIQSEHLFRYAILALCTWARPQAIVDFDPRRQADWAATTIDLAPPDWRPTNKRRPRQPMTQCIADWLVAWHRADEAQHRADVAAGRIPKPEVLLVYKRQRVASTKKAWRRIGRDLGIAGFSQYSFRHFMADQVRMMFRNVAREHRSLWLGHVVRDGSRTTDHYEGTDPMALADVALATDCVLNLLAERCQRPLFAIEARLKRDDLLAIGARMLPKNVVKSGKNGGRDRDRTCDPYHVKVVRMADYIAKSRKRRA